MAQPKGIKDAFAGFFEDPTRETLRALLQGHVGETRHLDFKTEWPEHSALAKQVLGLANTAGGVLVVGVQEQADKSLDPVGLAAFRDKADITNGLKNYLPANVLSQVSVLDLAYDTAEYSKIEGKKFQVAIIEFDAEAIPAVAVKAGTGIRKGAIYYRKEGVTEEATYDEIQIAINKRLTSERAAPEHDLDHHLRQLKVLYGAIEKTTQSNWLVPHLGQLSSVMKMLYSENPLYPAESYDQFIARMVALKKTVIEKELGSTRPIISGPTT